MRIGRWNKYNENFTIKIQKVEIDFIEDDYILNGFYQDGSFIFLHWTALSNKQQLIVSKLLEKCKEGTYVITLSNPLQSNDYEVFVQDICLTSWGKTEFYFHEKIK